MTRASLPHRQTAGNAHTIHLFHQCLRRGGGMERYALAVAGSLKSLGHEIVCHARQIDEATAQALGVGTDAVRVSRFPRKLQDFRFFCQVDRIRRNALGLQFALARVRANDIAICGGTHRGYLSRARKLTGPLDLLQIWMETQAYQCARTIVSHSKLCSNELVRWYRVPPEKIVTLYPPVDAEFTPADADHRAQSRSKLGLPADKIVFLFPSTGHSRKGLKPICEALRGLSSQLVLAVAGGRPQTGRWPFVQYLGYVDNMPEAYRAADFTILGSSYEPFGLVGPESILCGTSLVFEENIGCLEAVKPNCVRTFSVGDAESIRRAVLAAINLARQGGHRLTKTTDALCYNPSPIEHTRALLRAAMDR